MDQVDAKTKRLEEFRALIGDFEVEDSVYVLRAQQGAPNAHRPAAAGSGKRPIIKARKGNDETQANEEDQSRLTDQ